MLIITMHHHNRSTDRRKDSNDTILSNSPRLLQNSLFEKLTSLKNLKSASWKGRVTSDHDHRGACYANAISEFGKMTGSGGDGGGSSYRGLGSLQGGGGYGGM